MSCEVLILREFSLAVKKLSKKYKKIKYDLKNLLIELTNNPKAGIPLQNNCYKIRVKNSSTQSGKRGGFRVIYYFLDDNNKIYLMSIYSKNRKSNITEQEMLDILKDNNLT